MTNMKRKILVVVAHSDDESFGCGGFIKKLSLNNNIKAISFTNGVSSRSNQKIREIKEREKSSIDASKILGFNWMEQYNFDDNRLDKLSLLEII